MSASDVSPFHLRPARFTLLSDTCRWLGGVVFVFGLCFCFPAAFFASGRVVYKFLHLYSYR